MYEVWWKTNSGWEKLHTNVDFTVAKKWALDHISYTSSATLKVEIREPNNPPYVLWNKEWPVV